MSEPLSFAVPEDQHGLRADKVLAAQFKELSRTRLQSAFEKGEVWIEGEPIDKKARLCAGDWVEVILPETLPTSVNPVAMPIEVLFEDESLVVINKRSGVVTHPGSGTGEDTLVHGMLHYTQGQLAPAGGQLRPGVVHRLDKETSGAMVFAKTDEAHRALVSMFSARSVEKQYLALVQGVPPMARGSSKEPIGRNPFQRTKMQVSAHGRDAHTDWTVTERFAVAALVKCQIHTGRTHQIRVHLSHLGFPLLGDDTYGYRYREREPALARERVFLHAQFLRFAHPIKPSSVVSVEAPLPADFLALMDLLRAGKPSV